MRNAIAFRLKSGRVKASGPQFVKFSFYVFQQGLTDEQIEERLQRDGPNSLTPVDDTSEIAKLLKELFYGFNALMWIGAVLSFMVFGLSYLDPNSPEPDPSDVSTRDLSVWTFLFPLISPAFQTSLLFFPLVFSLKHT